MSDNISDIERYVKDWVCEYPLSQRYGRRYDRQDLDFIVNMDKLKYTFDKPKYTNKKRSKMPNSNVVYTTNYTNHTDDLQEVNIKVKRVTSATAKARIKHGFTGGYGVGLKLRMPTDVASTFGGNVEVDAEDGDTVEKKMSWSFSTKMAAPPRKKTVAKFEVNEERLSCDFATYVHIHGKVKVTVVVKRSGTLLLNEEVSMKKVLDEIIPEADDFFPRKNLIYMEPTSVKWPFRGSMNFHYGISQNEVIE